MGSMGYEVTPLEQPSKESCIDFGAAISGIDAEHLTDATFNVIRNALYEHSVVVLRNQKGLSSRAQYELTRRFDPDASLYSHGKTIDKRSVLHKDLTTVPGHPQVQIIGHGEVDAYEGLTNLKLTHPHHRTFHKHPVPLEDDRDVTHFYRWHIDSAMYELDPPRVTSLYAERVPQGRRQTLRYDDGSDERLDNVPLGTTAFVSGYRMYDLLSDDDKAWARQSVVEYAAHPYIWMSQCKARSNGLGLFSDGLELDASQLPPVDDAKIRRYPMVWENPVTGRLALMIYPTPARRIIHKSSTTGGDVVIKDLQTVRETIYRLQRPAISPQYVYPHDWAEGDLVLFHNHGVLHSIVGAFADGEVRLFRQCNMAASTPPQGPSGGNLT